MSSTEKKVADRTVVLFNVANQVAHYAYDIVRMATNEAQSDVRWTMFMSCSPYDDHIKITIMRIDDEGMKDHSTMYDLQLLLDMMNSETVRKNVASRTRGAIQELTK